MFNPAEMMKEAKEAKENQKRNHDAQIQALGRIEEVLKEIRDALKNPAPEEVK